MKTVCINALDDGTYSVELENESMPEGPEAPEGVDTQEDQSESGQSFQSLDDALNAARALLSGESGEQKPMIPGEEEFVAGFKQAKGIGQGY